MLEATSRNNELNDIDWHNMFLNIAMFDLPAYLLTMANIRLAGNTWEQALLEPLPIFCMALIDLYRKYVKNNT